MKFEFKVMIMSFVLSLVFMIAFTYILTIDQKTYYVYQVGIYKEEQNKNNRLNELKKNGINGYFYERDGQYYVLSHISDNQKDIEKQVQELKGIMKQYTVSQDVTEEKLLKLLSEGD